MPNSCKNTLFEKLKELAGEYPYLEDFLEITCAPNEIGKAGFPIIAEKSYMTFLERIPHLFKEGQSLLKLIELAQKEAQYLESKETIERALKVMERVTLTAGITAPSDLWLLRQVLSTFLEVGVTEEILKRRWFDYKKLSEKMSLDSQQLLFDLDFIHSRGLLEKKGSEFKMASCPQARNLFEKLELIPKSTSRNMVQSIVSVLKKEETKSDEVRDFFSFEPIVKKIIGWIPGPQEVQVGYRLLPLVLAVRFLESHMKLKEGVMIAESGLYFTNEMKFLLKEAGVVESGQVTKLGERVFSRGPGPYGIVHAYYAYMEHHLNLLKGKTEDFWVARGENVAASQDANSKSFKQINDALDKFCEKHNFSYQVFIEHAVGQGEATRQRFNRNGEDKISYFGADLEDAAIDKSIEAQKEGLLPKNMQFVRQADIGKASTLIEGLKSYKVNSKDAVMVVGNGFHEVRNQTNEKMIEVFREYATAGIVLAFTEESGLLDEDLLFTGWNTYHAGFRYVHEISGQGLRPAIDSEEGENARFSWKKCAALGGYKVLEEFTTRTRTIYPHPREDGYNPAISVNYFCIPDELAEKLGIK